MARPALLALLLLAACTRAAPPAASGTAPAGRDASALLLPEERRHLKSLRQLTFGGENAEAYFSFDGKRLVFQSTRDGEGCDQIYVMDADGSAVRRISPGGANTCAYFTPDGERIVYATTHLTERACPPKPDRSRGYVWPLTPAMDLVSVRLDGSDLRRLTDTPGYDAEGTISRDGRIVFTSVRDGDLDLYSMQLDGSGVQRLTREVGYDGGAFYSPDGTQLVWRASRPQPGPALDEYRQLLHDHLVKPGRLELIVARDDGTEPREITRNGAANFGPSWHPDGKRIVFSSNLERPDGFLFDLYLVPAAGGAPERITFSPEFDGFPMFSPDGKLLVFASNRGAKTRGETNLFLAEWQD